MLNDMGQFNLENFKRLRIIKSLELINSEVYICGFDLEDIILTIQINKKDISSLNSMEKEQLEFLIFVSDMLIKILNYTENFCKVNILFRKINLNNSIAFYQNILAFFYSMISMKSKFLSNKKFLITFPQIFSKEFKEYSQLNNSLDENNLEKFLSENFNSLINEAFENQINKNKIHMEDVYKLNNYFFISQRKNYFDFLRDEKYNDSSKLDFLQKVLLNNKYLLVEKISNIYYLNHFDDYLKVINPKKTEEKIQKLREKRNGSISSLECKVLQNIESTNKYLNLFNYENVGLGGSFDHIHIGHLILLTLGCLIAKKSLCIGITSDEMISKKGNKSIVQPFVIRSKMLSLFLNLIAKKIDVSFHSINDQCGTASKDKDLDCLVLTEETRKGGEMVNSERKKNGFSEVPLVFTDIIYTSRECFKKNYIQQDKKKNDFHTKISSSYFRQQIYCLISEEKLNKLYRIWQEFTIKNLQISYELSLNWFNIIRDYYTQSWRCYHSFSHIFNLMTLFDNFCEGYDNLINDKTTVFFAIFFHDIIYTPSRNDNEERSILLFHQFCCDIEKENEDFINKEILKKEKICFYISCTKNHFEHIEFTDQDLNLFLDFDLSGLGSDKDQYIENSRGIKYEYSHHLTEDMWFDGRRKFLNLVLDKKRIYRTDYFHSKYEINARDNILNEINTPI